MLQCDMKQQVYLDCLKTKQLYIRTKQLVHCKVSVYFNKK